MEVEPWVNSFSLFLLALCRVGGMVAFAPVISAPWIPFRIKAAGVVVLTLGMLPAIQGAGAAASGVDLVMGMASEAAFGAVMGMSASFVFMGARWAGELMGQQMGLGIGQVFDPQSGTSGTVPGELYLLLATAVFLAMNGHHALVRGLHASFVALPVTTAALDMEVFRVLGGLLQSATVLAIQLAAPMLITLLIVDVAIGVLSRAVPSANGMWLGISLRAVIGVGVMIVAVAVTTRVMDGAMFDALRAMETLWTRPAVR